MPISKCHRSCECWHLPGRSKEIGYPFQQWYAAAALGYQFKPILREHLRNIDPDKEQYFLFGGGYEFLHTMNSGKQTDENQQPSTGHSASTHG